MNRQKPYDTQKALSEEEYKSASFPASWLFGYFKPYIPAVAASFLLAVIVNIAALAGPYITEIVIDKHLAVRSGDIKALITLALSYFFIALVGAVTGYIQENLVARIGQSIIHKMRTELFDKIQRLSLRFFDHNSAGRIFTRLTSDIDAMSEMVSVVMISVFVDGIMLVGIIAAMFILSPKVALAAMPVIPVIIISIIIYKVFIKRTFVKVKAALAHMNGFLAETITGFGTVKLFGREPEKDGEFKALSGRLYKLGLREILLHTFSFPYMTMLNNLAIALLFWIFAPEIIGGAVEVGVVYAEVTYLRKFFDPVTALIDQYTNIQSALVSGERIYSVMTLDDEEDYESGERLEGKIHGELEFKNVTFAYEGDNDVIRDLSFKLPAGSRSAFVGATGSGKSTVISLVMRFYKIKSGDILLDGRSVYDINLRDLRHSIAIIQQEPFLFNGTVKRNITLGDNGYNFNSILKAAELTGAEDFIETLPNGYDSEVAERGRTFSAGQRQLISFTRAAVRTPSIFILDEATANIDTETEEHIKFALENASRGVTRITVAHRLSTIRDCDCIYVLKRGRLRESGTHAQLMEADGIYRRLYEYSSK